MDETISWIKEKEQLMASDDFGRDLASVQALLRKHERLERDLAALEDKVSLTVHLILSNNNSRLFIYLFFNPRTHVMLYVSPSVYVQVNTLGGEAERLQQTHPQNASQIQLKRDELITNWEQIRTLAAERHARLNDSYRYTLFTL